MANSDAKAFFKGLEEFCIPQEGLGCPYDYHLKGNRYLCSFDKKPCRLGVSPLGVHCERHGSPSNMDEKAGKTYWAEFFHYAEGLSPEERKKIFEEHSIKGDTVLDSTRWDALLYHMREAVVAKYGKKAAYVIK